MALIKSIIDKLIAELKKAPPEVKSQLKETKNELFLLLVVFHDRIKEQFECDTKRHINC